MKNNSVNLMLRFLLEVAALFIYAYWGWQEYPGWKGIISAFILPVVAASAWGVFAVKDDPSRSGKTVISTPGFIRLLIEFGLFTLATLALIDMEYKTWATILVAFTVLHYALSMDRIIWLIKK